MRVLLYQPFPDPWRQSMRVYAGALARHLADIAGPGDCVEPVALEGAHLRPPLRYFDQYVRYQRLARRTGAGVHHVLDHGFAHLTSALPRRSAVVTFHDAMPLRTGSASAGTRRALDLGMRRAIAAEARFITGSAASRSDLQHFYGVEPASIAVVPYGVDERFAPAADRDALRERLGLRRAAVLVVGHTQPYMNVDGALAAAAHASRSIDLEVIKIGAPLSVEQGRRAMDAGLDGRLRECGIVPDDQIREWYAAADALVYLPTLSGFGLPVLEAMASGLPVVASATGAVPEVAGDAAVLVDPRDGRAAGEALAGVLSDEPARASLRARGLARAAGFSWRRTAALTRAVYESVGDGA